MKKFYAPLFFFLFLAFSSSAQNTFCNPNGTVAIFSNYDGGVLHINVDQNIPNLRIGIVSYEDDSVIISGTFVNNVTAVLYAGYYNSGNVNCATNVGVKGVYGVSNSIVTIVSMPTANYNNNNGWPQIICNYSCSTTTNQGGCNTPDQVVAYFNQQFGTTNSDVLFHFTQYNCWTTNSTYAISAGGNCCAMPVTTGEQEQHMLEGISVYPNPASDKLFLGTNVLSTGNVQFSIINELGQVVYTEKLELNGSFNKEIDLAGIARGMYAVRLQGADATAVKKIVIE